ncbi:MAG TPA: SMP-30/gluconolactonase/LRE family protein [Kaistia sp.]|nr:SMP-30/gluconolactonase/LRE family protein [Kaistia sp.]
MSTLELGDCTLVVPAGDRCGEAALWHADEAALYWCDINRFLIHRYDATLKTTRSWTFDAPVVALSLTSEAGRMLVALASGMLWWWPADDSRVDGGFALPGWPAVRLNDGRSDPIGNFWVGSMRNNVGPSGDVLPAGGTDGKLFRIAPDGTVQVFRDGLAVSNTLCWSPDRTRFYFADTMENVIWVQPYDEATGTIGEASVLFAGFERGGPDGSAIDSEGYLWNCRFGGGCIVRIAPDGSIDRVIDMPVTNPTTCAFGGPELKTLYVTSASIFTPETERLAGSVFSMESSVAGLPENRFTIA